MAIVAAARYADLVGITTVAGNAPLERTTYNARVMRDLLSLDVPVHSGSPRPLVAEPQFAAFVHGESGLDGADLPAPTTPLDGIDAVTFIVDTCRAVDDVWLVPVGPLTNIALALRAAPDIASRIAGISLMGGGTFGNRTSTGEFNIWADPEAASIVFGYGGRLVMAGLDVTHQFQATPGTHCSNRCTPRTARRRLRRPVRLLQRQLSLTPRPRFPRGRRSARSARCARAHPSTLFDRVDRHVAIETRGEFTRGMTVIDQRSIIERRPANCEVLTRVDAEAGFDLLIDAVAHFSR